VPLPDRFLDNILLVKRGHHNSDHCSLQFRNTSFFLLPKFHAVTTTILTAFANR
jgi:hypothetical protein